MPLTQEDINKLLAVEVSKVKEIRPQIGPLRRYEKEMRCASRGCGTSTYFKVQGVPYCQAHALAELNEILVAAGFKGYIDIHTYRPTPVPEGRQVSATTRARLDIGWTAGNFECIHGTNLLKACDYCEG